MTSGATTAPDVAVVIVNYKTPSLTVQCVRSLLGSDDATLAVLVIDNASDDGSAAQIAAAFANDARVTVHARAVNDGYAGGNNAGVRLARATGARWALLLNSDTELDPACVRRLLHEGERNARTALVSPRIFFGDDPTKLWYGGARFSLWTGRPVHVGFRRVASSGWEHARDVPFATGCALLVRLAAVPNDVFDGSLFSYAEDLDLSLRMREAGWRVRYVPEAVVWHYEGSSHRRAGGQALRFYLNTRNLLRVVARHARWYHWATLGPALAVDVVLRFVVVSALAGDFEGVQAVLRGAGHAVSGGRHAIERREAAEG